MSLLASRSGDRPRHSVASLHPAKPDSDEAGGNSAQKATAADSNSWLCRMERTQTHLRNTQGAVTELVTRTAQLRSQLDHVNNQATLLMSLQLEELNSMRHVTRMSSSNVALDANKRHRPQRGESAASSGKKKLTNKEKNANREAESGTYGRSNDDGHRRRKDTLADASAFGTGNVRSGESSSEKRTSDMDGCATDAHAAHTEVVLDAAGNALDGKRRERVMHALHTLFLSPKNNSALDEMDASQLIAGNTNSAEKENNASTAMVTVSSTITNVDSKKGNNTNNNYAATAPAKMAGAENNRPSEALSQTSSASATAGATAFTQVLATDEACAEVTLDTPRCPREVPTALWDDMLQLRRKRLQIDAELAILAQYLVKLETRLNVLQRTQLLCRYAISTQSYDGQLFDLDLC